MPITPMYLAWKAALLIATLALHYAAPGIATNTVAATLITFILFTALVRLLFLAGPAVMPMVIVSAIGAPVISLAAMSAFHFL